MGKNGTNLGVKNDKSQLIIYHPLMDTLKKSIHGTNKTSKFLQFDIMNDKINDCFEILMIIAHVSLDIH